MRDDGSPWGETTPAAAQWLPSAGDSSAVLVTLETNIIKALSTQPEHELYSHPARPRPALFCFSQMVEFVANYRRSSNINGKLSYSNLYTSISVLAGHYASYGPKFPVPEKRKKRLLQVRDR